MRIFFLIKNVYNATVFDIRTSSFFFHFGYKKSLYGIVDLGAALTEIKIQKRSIL